MGRRLRREGSRDGCLLGSELNMAGDTAELRPQSWVLGMGVGHRSREVSVSRALGDVGFIAARVG